MSDDTNRPKLGLADAYSVRTPDDNRALYRDWADTYETEFAQARGYVYHEGVAALFAGEQPDLSAAVLDVGCGTGKVGDALRQLGFTTIDGIDLSPEMMAKAAEKGAYRSLAEADVTQPLAIDTAVYGGVVSVGTFTHGHLGPEPIRELVRVGGSGAVFALGINAEHYESQGFAALFDELAAGGLISPVAYERVRIYTAADDQHADDLALVALFRRL